MTPKLALQTEILLQSTFDVQFLVIRNYWHPKWMLIKTYWHHRLVLIKLIGTPNWWKKFLLFSLSLCSKSASQPEKTSMQKVKLFANKRKILIIWKNKRTSSTQVEKRRSSQAGRCNLRNFQLLTDDWLTSVGGRRWMLSHFTIKTKPFQPWGRLNLQEGGKLLWDVFGIF